jgi:uncharacterized repeat protein (TIGR01451 family)
MRKTLIITLFALVFCLYGRGQSCLPNGISFSTQASIDNFSTNYPGCTQIEGNIYISGANITNLNGLSAITSVNGLAIENNPALASLNGLNNLTTLGNFTWSYISGNPLLTNLNGLENLVSAYLFDITQNASLTNLNGLEKLQTVDGRLRVEYNPLLTNLSGLGSLKNVIEFIISGNSSLTSLDGPANITSVGSLNISGNSILTSLSGFQNLSSVGDVTISNNPALVNLNGLFNGTAIGGLTVSNNASLTSISEVSNVTSFGGGLGIYNNPMLLNLNGLENVSTLTSLVISTNPLISNLNNLSNLKSVDLLEISGNPGLTNLTGLNQLDSASYFTIINNVNLTNLGGLENLTKIQNGIGIWGNPALKNLNALNHVTNAPYWISIRENKALLNLQGLEGISAVLDTVHIVGNNALANLSGLNNMTAIGTLNIAYNNAMTSFAGLEKLNQVGELYIRYNPLLANIDALKQLERIVDGEFEELYIEENASLTNLSGLENLSVLGGYLRVLNNPLLSDCAVYAVCNHILNEPSSVTISGNASGCSTPAEVELQCHSIPVVAEVRLDSNGNCQADQTDPPASDVQVRLESVGQMLLKATNQQGRTRFGYLENGPFDLFLPQFPAGNWAVCQEPLTFNPNGSTDTIRATLLLSPLIQCPELTVHLGLPSFFRGCLRTSDLQVFTENTGTVTAQGVKIAVVIPPVLELLASVPPLAGQQGDTLFFDLGDLAPFGKSNVTLTVKTKCDDLVGHAICIETFATLDNACPKNLPAFSEIKASAKCIGGNLVRLSLENIGDAPTQGYHAYKIIRNDLIMNDNPFNLAAHESLSFDFNADGATWRLEATKFDDGTETAASVENCNGLTPGWITGFWQDHGPLEYDFDCRQVNGSYDPNLKTVLPSTIGIRPNKPLQYTIDFQNIGNDTAFRVLLRDVLPVSLDLNTFHPRYASHPYNWEIKGQTLEVLFDPISLPGSGMNEPASHGFFSFEIDQKHDLPDYTYIQNTATIVFDFNQPIYTNYTTNIVVSRLTVHVDEAQVNAIAWQVLGNPTSNAAVLRATEFIPGDKQFELYDVSGKRVRSAAFSGQTFEFQRDMLGDGMYFFRISDERGRVFTGKIILTE